MIQGEVTDRSEPIVDIEGDRTTAAVRRGADAFNDLDKRISPSDVSYRIVLRARNRCQDRQRKGPSWTVRRLSRQEDWWFPDFRRTPDHTSVNYRLRPSASPISTRRRPL